MVSRIVSNEISYHGASVIQGIVNEIKARGFKEAFVCSDPDPIKFNVTCRVIKVLGNAGLAYKIYSDIKPNPATGNMQTGAAALKAPGANYIIAIDGGSPTDTSKAIGVIITDPEFEDARSLEGVAPTKNPRASTIAAPTTAGTAAEVTISYAITDAEKKRKFVCVDTHDIPAVAVTDPEMTSSMPRGLTAVTGMDVLIHVIEGYTIKGAWKMANMFNLKAIEAIARNLRDAVENKSEGREGVVLGQYLTGMGFSNCGLGIVHSTAYGLGALYDTLYGAASAIILPTVMEYNTPCTGTELKDITAATGVEGVENMTQEEYHKATVDVVKKLSADVGIPVDLKEIVKPEDMDFLSQSVMDDACRPGSPKDPSFEDIENLYLSLMQLHRQLPMAEEKP